MTRLQLKRRYSMVLLLRPNLPHSRGHCTPSCTMEKTIGNHDKQRNSTPLLPLFLSFLQQLMHSRTKSKFFIHQGNDYLPISYLCNPFSNDVFQAFFTTFRKQSTFNSNNMCRVKTLELQHLIEMHKVFMIVCWLAQILKPHLKGSVQ